MERLETLTSSAFWYILYLQFSASSGVLLFNVFFFSFCAHVPEKIWKMYNLDDHEFCHCLWFHFPESSLACLFHWNVSYFVLLAIILTLELCYEYFCSIRVIEVFCVWPRILVLMHSDCQKVFSRLLVAHCIALLDSLVCRMIVYLCLKECSGKFPVRVVCWKALL